jgi:chemotaxis protein methyltransferase CheR
LAQGREFVWTDADFARVKSLIYQRAGISLHDGKHAMVYSRLSRRLRETGHTSFSELFGVAGISKATGTNGRSLSTR